MKISRTHIKKILAVAMCTYNPRLWETQRRELMGLVAISLPHSAKIPSLGRNKADSDKAGHSTSSSSTPPHMHIHIFLKDTLKPVLVEHACNHSPQEAKAELQQVQDTLVYLLSFSLARIHNEML